VVPDGDVPVLHLHTDRAIDRRTAMHSREDRAG
jgi:hypothetical protein